MLENSEVSYKIALLLFCLKQNAKKEKNYLNGCLAELTITYNKKTISQTHVLLTVIDSVPTAGN